MRLSTFNTNRALPLVALGACAAIAASYNLWLATTKSCGAPFNSARLNAIRFQQYAIQRKKPEMVALGSSLLERVMGAVNDPKVENLCILAYSALDGANFIKYTGRYPKVALIELSIRLAYTERIDCEKELPRYRIWMARQTKLARTEFQPSCQLYRGLARQDEVYHFKDAIKLTVPPQFVHTFKRPAIQQAIMPNSTSDMMGNIKKLKKAVRNLERHGTKVCYVIVPKTPYLEELARQEWEMEIFSREFPKSSNRWIEWSGDPRIWDSPDGWHLTAAETKLFAADMLEQLRKMNFES